MILITWTVCMIQLLIGCWPQIQVSWKLPSIYFILFGFILIYLIWVCLFHLNLFHFFFTSSVFTLFQCSLSYSYLILAFIVFLLFFNTFLAPVIIPFHFFSWVLFYFTYHLFLFLFHSSLYTFHFLFFTSNFFKKNDFSY